MCVLCLPRQRPTEGSRPGKEGLHQGPASAWKSTEEVGGKEKSRECTLRPMFIESLGKFTLTVGQPGKQALPGRAVSYKSRAELGGLRCWETLGYRRKPVSLESEQSKLKLPPCC